MCDFKILENDEFGYATQCFECNHVEIAFGTSLIRFPVERLGAFVKYLNDVKMAAKAVDRSKKNIILDLASMSSFQMILSYDEMIQFCERAERVEDEVKANVLLGLFNC
ncbi:MAG: hypothetical protein EOO04_05620 [Chitinophagaceae bacterium]|nr:MAG: hypothetical protein EOO04_05620 [Chitinophagaceae bacterium]